MASVGASLVPPARFVPVCALAVLVCLPGCAAIRVERARRSALQASWRASAVHHCRLSPRTEQTLRQWDLDGVYARAPADAVARLHAEALRDPRPDLLFALAEINYVRGRQAEKTDCASASVFYYLCAGYAYHYLFDEPPRPAPDLDPAVKQAGGPPEPPPLAGVRASVFDPRFRLACDLYNAALAKCIVAAQRVGRLDPRQALRLPTPDGQGFTLSVMQHGFTWKPEEFGPLLLCEDYEVVGLANAHRSYGLGVPLIATRADGPKEGEEDKGGAARRPFYPRDATCAATAFFRFEGGLADLGASRSGRLELYNPLTVQTVAAGGQGVPLETDLTTPLAYFLANSKLGNITEWANFLYGDQVPGYTGIRMLAPYQPGKVPVVLVHGLLSSPLTWAPVVNDLQADPVLRERYQFWYYFYPTGSPYLATAVDLRRELHQLRDELDPRHQDDALDQMVFIGHSMGGLVSKLMTVDSGDDFWHLVGNEPFDGLKLREEVREELRQTFFFERQSCVKRVVFIGTPHHGSKLSPSPLGRLAVHLVRLPHDVLTASRDLVTENPDLPTLLRTRPLPTSVDLLAPNAPALELLAARPRPERVHYHSIVGVVSTPSTNVERWLAGDSAEPGDGIVPYRSAHLESADSELVVPADHFHVHHHPLALLEIRRILLEHYQAVTRQRDEKRELRPVSGPLEHGDSSPLSLEERQKGR